MRGVRVVLFVAASAGACATAGSGDVGTLGQGTGADASVDTGAGDDVVGPSPDAVVLGIDAPAGDDASDANSPPDVGDDGHASKSCTGLPDGTPCGAAPDICHDAPLCQGGSCAAAASKADGFVCGPAPDICHDAPLCQGGSCAAAASKADGFVCGSVPDSCHDAPACKAGVCGAPATRADGTNWTPGDGTARCCSGKPIHTTVNTDCGACGIQCNGSNGESCQSFGGEWFCRGCVASAACWSHCCSTVYSPYSCAASDCAGNCSAQYCPPGAHCVAGTVTSDYCSY